MSSRSDPGGSAFHDGFRGRRARVKDGWRLKRWSDSWLATGCRGLARLGHMGVWAGLYVGAAFVMATQLAAGGRLGPRPDLLLGVVLVASACYALDRVKLRDGWIDPADVEGQAERYAF